MEIIIDSRRPQISWPTLDESLKEVRFEYLKSEAGIFFYKKKGIKLTLVLSTLTTHYPVALTRLLLMPSKYSSYESSGRAKTLENQMSFSECVSLAKIMWWTWISVYKLNNVFHVCYIHLENVYTVTSMTCYDCLWSPFPVLLYHRLCQFTQQAASSANICLYYQARPIFCFP